MPGSEQCHGCSRSPNPGPPQTGAGFQLDGVEVEVGDDPDIAHYGGDADGQFSWPFCC